jgi:hypothetical protein
MPQAIGLAVAILFGEVCLVALFITLRALFPHRLARAQTVADRMPGRALLVGLVNFLFFSALTLAFVALSQLTKVALLGLPGVFFLALLAIGLSLGLASVAQLVGQRVATARTELMQTVLGTLTLSFACLMPFIGWFILLPYAGFLGMGAFVVGLFYRERPAPEVTPNA